MSRPFISISSDFGIASEGCGVMKATVLKYCSEANVVDLTHEISPFSIHQGARQLEAVISLPVGIHVCVVDPSVGTKRRGLVIATRRGDYIIGPDNGVLMPAVARLGGAVKAVVLENEKYMQLPVSPTFHGRDVFCTAAGHLASGVKLEQFGKAVPHEHLARAPYNAATINDEKIRGEIIHVNKHNFNAYSNIYAEQLKFLGISHGDAVAVRIGKHSIRCLLLKTFGEAEEGKPLLYTDDYGHVAIALNKGFFAKKYPVSISEAFVIGK